MRNSRRNMKAVSFQAWQKLVSTDIQLGSHHGADTSLRCSFARNDSWIWLLDDRLWGRFRIQGSCVVCRCPWARVMCARIDYSSQLPITRETSYLPTVVKFTAQSRQPYSSRSRNILNHPATQNEKREDAARTRNDTVEESTMSFLTVKLG